MSGRLVVNVAGKQFPVATLETYCQHCRRPMTIRMHDQERGRGKFCSVRCAEAGKAFSDCVGEANGRAKLTAKDVTEIREYLERGWSQTTLVIMYGVSPSTIWSVKTGRAWNK